MATTITYTTIDEAYPVAGVDNDTQGFRDNFAIIKQALQDAATEVSALNEFAVRTDQTSAFNGTGLEGPELRQWTQQVVDHGTDLGAVENDLNINWNAAAYQAYQVVAPVTFTFAEWPETGTYGEVTVQVLADDTPRTITFATESPGTIKYGPGFPETITVTSSTNPILFKFWTIDSGATVYAQYLGEFS
jgi:hypothetical protein